MSLIIKIGEPVGRNSVRDEKHDNAPADGVPTDYTNERWPSHYTWKQSIIRLGLHDLMWGDGGLDANKTSYRTRIRKKHIKEFDKIYAEFQKKLPEIEINIELTCDIARLEWLKYWLHWAVENCKKPTFYCA